MAHRILGIDLGSHSVKIAVVVAGFRKTQVVDWLELPLPAALEGDTLETRQARAVGGVLRARGLEHDFPFTTLPGDALSIRVLDFQFQSLKRAELDKAVGVELEDQLPIELDDMVYAFDVLPRDLPLAPDAAPQPGTRVLAAATTRDRVGNLIAAHAGEQAEPHGVIAAPAAYGKTVAGLAALADDAGGGAPVMVLDVGHARTNVCVLHRGRVVFARTLSRGGRHVTQAIARAWGLSFDEAEESKHQHGVISSDREPVTSEYRGMSDVVRGELTPLARELRQTLAACRAQVGVEVARAVVCGGGSRLRGLPAYLGEELDLPVGVVTPDDGARLLGLAAAKAPADLALLSLGVALEGASGRPAFDLRTGPLAYKHDFSFLRARAGYLVACGLALAAFFAGNAYAALYKLRAEAAVLDKRLETETTEIFGAAVSLDDVEARLDRKAVESPLPKMTAFDVLVDMSKHLPPNTEGKIDVLELEIEPKKLFFKAIADSAATIDAVEKKLKEIDCFGDIQRGRVDTVNDGRQFTMTIATKCQ
jgi:general secretion pathway protein L